MKFYLVGVAAAAFSFSTPILASPSATGKSATSQAEVTDALSPAGISSSLKEGRKWSAAESRYGLPRAIASESSSIEATAFARQSRAALRWEVSYLALSAIDTAQTIVCLQHGACEEAKPVSGDAPHVRHSGTGSWECPHCGRKTCSPAEPPTNLFRPWHIRNRAAIKAYVESLGKEATEWLLVLYVSDQFQLLSVETAAHGDVSSCPVTFWPILSRAHALNAKGFILIHNHPSGDPRPSDSDIRMTRKLFYLSSDLDVPLLDHLIIAGDQMIAVGWD